MTKEWAMRTQSIATAAILLLALWPTNASSETYQSPADFVAELFGDRDPELHTLWLDADLKGSISEIMGHPLNLLRIRYWEAGGTTVWVLNEIGKELPITAGFAVEGKEIKTARILIYREDRGYEVRYPWFTAQFTGMRLEEDRRPSAGVDGISGATLSVRAVTNMARLALYLHDEVMKDSDD